MGFFDRFKKSKDTMTNNKQEVNQLPFDIKYSQTCDGELQVEFRYSNFKRFYDTTRLIISERPLNIEGYEVYDCKVSWYESSDCELFNEKTGKFENLDAQQYQEILAEIDLNLLQRDQNYCDKLMNGLLDKKRVQRYLESGLQESPEQPCGNYIGGVKQTEKGYSKFFSTVVGRISHNSELMRNRRQEHLANIEARKQKAIEDKRNQIKKLQMELDSMER